MKNHFKIISIMVVKNEGDIINDVIISALKWSDYIIIMDNGSDDETLGIINDLSGNHHNVIFWGSYLGRFHDSLRQRIYKDYAYLSMDGDWWCRLDADEIYIDNPRDFISNQSPIVDHINSASFQYYITEKEFNTEVDYKKLNFYLCNWSECRFFKQGKGVVWPDSSPWPLNLFKRSREFIRLKHYQYRSIEQIKNRISVRKSNVEDNLTFNHDRVGGAEWYLHRKFMIPEDDEMLLNKIVMSNDLCSGVNYEIPATFIDRFKWKENRVKRGLAPILIKLYLLIGRIYKKNS